MSGQQHGPRYESSSTRSVSSLDITEALTEQMNALGMNREEVATAAGVNPDELQQELQGSARMSLRKLIRVAIVLGVEPRLTPRRGMRRRGRA